MFLQEEEEARMRFKIISLLPIPFGEEWSGSKTRVRLSGELKEANYDGIHSTY